MKRVRWKRTNIYAEQSRVFAGIRRRMKYINNLFVFLVAGILFGDHKMFWVALSHIKMAKPLNEDAQNFC